MVGQHWSSCFSTRQFFPTGLMKGHTLNTRRIACLRTGGFRDYVVFGIGWFSGMGGFSGSGGFLGLSSCARGIKWLCSWDWVVVLLVLRSVNNTVV